MPVPLLVAAVALQITGKAGVDSVLAASRKVIATLADTTAAAESGFVPLVIGEFEDLTPFQGQHWLHRARAERSFADLGWPSFVMFVPINGRWQAAGLAYSSRIGHDDPPPMELAGVHAPWHLHQWCFAIPGEGIALADGFDDCMRRHGRPTPQQLAMVHVWTSVPSPEGPFAHDNPALPFLAVGLRPPTSDDLSDPLERHAVRQLALALGETYGARMPYARRVDILNNDPNLTQAAEALRREIAEVIPTLRHAEQAGDTAAYEAAAAKARAAWERLSAVYEQMAPSPEMRAELRRQHRMALGETGHHGTSHRR
jgi:hypothetical protein